MKFAKIMMLLLTVFVIAFGAAFYMNPRLAGKTACEIDGSVAGGCGKCGDGYCNPRCGETSASCPRDCGIVSTK